MYLAGASFTVRILSARHLQGPALAAPLSVLAAPCPPEVTQALPGLRDQAPGSELLAKLNATVSGQNPADHYFAVRSNYEPRDAGLIKVVLDAGVDRLFHNKENDLVVPTLGVSETDKFILDPNSRVKSFGLAQTEDVAHTRFFAHRDTWNHILTSLC